MVYVKNYSASEIKREPTKEERAIVEKSRRRVNELYIHYSELDKSIGMELLQRFWNEYLKELKKYNDLYNKYIGYCY